MYEIQSQILTEDAVKTPGVKGLRSSAVHLWSDHPGHILIPGVNRAGGDFTRDWPNKKGIKHERVRCYNKDWQDGVMWPDEKHYAVALPKLIIFQ